jgi:hypothetical protein
MTRGRLGSTLAETRSRAGVKAELEDSGLLWANVGLRIFVGRKGKIWERRVASRSDPVATG